MLLTIAPGRLAGNLPAIDSALRMFPTVEHQHDPVAALVAARENLLAEADRLAAVIAAVQAEHAAARQVKLRADVGEQLGATKLARFLGCSRTHAQKLLGHDLAHATRTRPNGTRWISRQDVEAWLASEEPAA